MAPDNAGKEERTEEVPPFVGGYARVVRTNNLGKRPFDTPDGIAKPVKESEEDANRAPGLPQEVKDELAKERKVRAALAAKKAKVAEDEVSEAKDSASTRRNRST